jgi:hypothetical protein
MCRRLLVCGFLPKSRVEINRRLTVYGTSNAMRQTVFFLCLTALLTACGERSAQKPTPPTLPTVSITTVVSLQLERDLRLPGE